MPTGTQQDIKEQIRQVEEARQPLARATENDEMPKSFGPRRTPNSMNQTQTKQHTLFLAIWCTYVRFGLVFNFWIRFLSCRSGLYWFKLSEHPGQFSSPRELNASHDMTASSKVIALPDLACSSSECDPSASDGKCFLDVDSSSFIGVAVTFSASGFGLAKDMVISF
eukprot:2983532-Amphidinium_carterae.1